MHMVAERDTPARQCTRQPPRGGRRSDDGLYYSGNFSVDKLNTSF